MKEMRCLHCYSNEFSERNGHLYCLYCGSKYRQRPEDQEILLSMAYRELRFMNFLDAENAFEDIISRHPDLPEAYWGCVCARYGIKFEQDYTGKQIPTCCLPAIESILEDRYYQKALELSDEETAGWYRGQGEYLERVRKTWIERARKLAPYDVFISYKDSDQEKGLDRTEDSLKAQSIYTHLVTQGYSVFYSRESLSNVIGEKYEPYIFQALSTSRAMIVYGSTPEYINSTWVRNEWQRYAKKMQKGEKDKGSLIVICDGFSPKDLPPMLRSMQVLDGRDMFCYSKLDEHLKGLLAKKASPEEEAKKKAEEEARQKLAEETKADKERQKLEKKLSRDDETIVLAPGQTTYKDSQGTHIVQKEETLKERTGNFVFSHVKLIIFIAAMVILAACIVFDMKERMEIPEQTEPVVVEYDDSEEDEPEISASEGLQFSSNGDGTCTLSGIGNCKDTKIVIPEESPKGDKVTSIGESAFYNCATLTSIEIPDGVTRIGGYGFSYCSNLTNVILPDSLTSIGYLSFYGCSALTSITVEKGNSIFHSAGNCLIDTHNKILILGSNNSTIPKDGSVTSIGDYAFIGRSSLTDITIPDGVTSIGERAFLNCSAMTSITIPNSVTNIGDYAFSGCSSLTDITIPDGVTNIGDNTFYNCSSLTGITIPDGVTNIGAYAFNSCSCLIGIVIPNSVTSIGDYAFWLCDALTTINFQGTKAEWNAIEKGEGWIAYTGNCTIHCTDGDIPKSES